MPRFNLSLNKNADHQLKKLMYFFDTDRATLFKKGMGFLQLYMEYLKQYPNMKVVFKDEDEDIVEITIFHDS